MVCTLATVSFFFCFLFFVFLFFVFLFFVFLSCFVLFCLVLSCFVLFCFVLFCLFCFVLFICFVSCRFVLFLFLFFVSYRNESIPTLNFTSQNYLTCFRHHLNTTRSRTRMQWSKRERHRAHMYCSPWYWRLMASLPGRLVAPSPSRNMLSRMLVSLTSISDTLNTYHLLLQPQQFRTSLATCLNWEDYSSLSTRTSAHSSKT